MSAAFSVSGALEDSVAPLGIARVVAFYPRLVPWAGFCRRPSASLRAGFCGWVGWRGKRAFALRAFGGQECASCIFTQCKSPTSRKGREKWGTRVGLFLFCVAEKSVRI